MHWVSNLCIVGHEEIGVCKEGQDLFTMFHTDFDNRHIRSVVTRFSSFNTEAPQLFMLERSSQDNLEGGDWVADEAEEHESCEVLSCSTKESRLFCTSFCCY
jgi:hypothetical protein